MKYTLEMDDDGRRFWLCEHADGSLDPLPPGYMLDFRTDKDEEGTFRLPIGAKVTLEIPEDVKRLEQEAILRVLRKSVQVAHATETGEQLSKEAADEIVVKVLRELASAEAGEATPSAPGIIPATLADLPSARKLADLVARLRQ